MPKKVTAYACEFGCGRNVTTKRKTMMVHEKICFYNPSRHACQTCRHKVMESDTYYNPYHNGNPGSTDYEMFYPYCDARDDINLKDKYYFDCPFWKQKLSKYKKLSATAVKKNIQTPDKLLC